MRFSEWKEIAELVGLAAIIASLVFVGLQLKQSQDIALATQYKSRAEATQASTLTHLETRWLYQSTASISSISDVIARCISLVSFDSLNRPGFSGGFLF